MCLCCARSISRALLCETLRASLAFDIHLHLFAHIFFKVCSYSCITASGVLCAVCLVTTLSYFASLAFFFPAAKSSSSSSGTAFFFFFSPLVIASSTINLKGFFSFLFLGDGLISSLPQPISKQQPPDLFSFVEIMSVRCEISPALACYSVCLRSTNKKYEQKQMWML